MRTVPLRRLAHIVNGGTPKGDASNWDGDVPWATPVDLGTAHGGELSDTLRTLTDEGLETGSSAVPAGSVLLSTRAPVGYVAIATQRMAFNQGCKALVPDKRLNSRYLAYALQASTANLQVRSNGTTFLELSTEALKSTRIPYLTVPKQVQIADFLDRETAQIDAMIEAQEHLLTLTHERRRAAIAYHLDAERCCLLGPRMKHVVTGVRQGVSPQCLPHPADGVSEWGVLKVGCVNSGIFNALENKKLPDEISPDPSCVPGIGDIVISRANTRTLLGSAAVVTKAMPRLMLSDKLYAFNVGHNNPHFIALILGTRPYRDLIEIEATGTSDSMQNISLHSILDLPMNVPTLDEQNERVARLQTTLRTMDTLIIGVHEMLSLLQERREALITAAVSGRIDPTTGIERIEEAS